MTTQEYLEKRLKEVSTYKPSEEDFKVVQFEGIEAYIYRKLKSKKFRKTSIDADSEKRIKEAIALNVKAGKPIKFTYPFGAYKLWRLPSHPNVDWSEFFVIAYVIEYIAPILAMYEPGVEFIFSSDDVCIELIDNYPREELDAYNESFNNLLKEFRKYIPNNLNISLVQIVPDVYNREEYDKEIQELYDVRKAQGFTDEQRAGMMQKMELHFRAKGAKDYGELNQEEKIKVWEDLTFWSDAYLKLSKRRAFDRADDAIVVFSKKIANAIDIGSTRVSKTSFWVGIGVLETLDGKFFERILSVKQWESTKDRAEEEKISLLKIKEFKTIDVYKERLKFR